MLVLLSLAFLSGLVTILAPCIWPLLPIVLGSATTGGFKRSLGITVGVCLSFTFFTLALSYLVKLFPFDPNFLRLIAVVVLAFTGFSLLIPQIAAKLETLLPRFQPKNDNGLITGLSLGLVWSPCAGPILASVAALAVTTSLNGQAILVMLFFVAGLAIPLFLFTLAGNTLFTKTKFLNPYLGRIQQVFGAIMIVTALAIFTNYDKVLQTKLLDAFPSYTNFITNLGNKPIDEKANSLLGKPMNPTSPSGLENLGHASDFTGATHWLNTPAPIRLSDLKGKVVLVDFWTYTCINCIRTLPHVVEWNQKYKDKGLVIVGIHTPEFEFEKDTKNVESAIKQFGIKYPVGQDNNYEVWNAYANHYWPAKYLIDQDGIIRYTHFGEGDYDATEKHIQEFLGLDMATSNMPDQTPTTRLTPETYLGSARAIPNSFSLSGQWTTGDEEITAGKDAVLELNFTASKVFLVMKGQGQVKVFLDGVEQQTITVDSDKLYQLIDLPSVGNHLLRLEFSPGVSAFAFTFG